MQFYLDGYRTGDPMLERPHPSVADRPDELPEEVDVLIVGCGPAGLVLAAQLARFPDITTMIIDRRDGPLGWKLGAVLRGTARPELLDTYSAERQVIAQELIDFDREFAKMFSAPPKDSAGDGGDGVDPAEFQRYFAAQGRFTAGVATRYAPSMITGDAAFQHLATGLPIGMRFHSAPVIRLADAKPMQLGHAARADGAWRVYVFADRDHPALVDSRARELCEFLASEGSPVARFTPAGADPDSGIDVRAVFQQGHRELAVSDLPTVLLPRKGPFGLIDYEKAFCPDPEAGDVFDLRGVDRDAGCVVVVRPDQYVATVLPLDARQELSDFFAGIMVDAG